MASPSRKDSGASLLAAGQSQSSIAPIYPPVSQDSMGPLGPLKGSMASIDDIHDQVVDLLDLRQLLTSLHGQMQRMESTLSYQTVVVEEMRTSLVGVGPGSSIPGSSSSQMLAGAMSRMESGRPQNMFRRTRSRAGSKERSPGTREPVKVTPPELIQAATPSADEMLPGVLASRVSSSDAGGVSLGLADYQASPSKSSFFLKSNQRRLTDPSSVRATKSVAEAAAGATKSLAVGKQLRERRQELLRDIRRKSTQYGMMDELEACTARQLQQRSRRRSTQKDQTRAVEERTQSSSMLPVRDSSATPSQANQMVGFSPSRSAKSILPVPEPSSPAREDADDVVKLTSEAFDSSEEDGGDAEQQNEFKNSRARMLKRCRRVSLEELQDNYDADRMNHGIMTSHEMSPFHSDDDGGQKKDLPKGANSALVGVARFFLGLVGILDFREGLLWWLLSLVSMLVPVAVFAGNLTLYTLEGEDARSYSGIFCYLVGGVLSTLSLRRAGITSLLGPTETRFDEYAEEMGFLQDWRQVSLRRFCEVAALYVLMVTSRVLASVISTEATYGRVTIGGFAAALPGFAFCFIALTLCLVCYCQLHVCCGLELAIDSFGLRLFRDMDMEKALEEWNLVQATLRQVSSKISGSMFILGACCFATLMFLAEQLWHNPGVLQKYFDTGLWMGWLYPPILLFAYSMMRAAAVSEKASRVAPLVNSWKFDADDDGEALWMDADRQYVVQYIIQSEAGFYVKGVRLTAGSVQKMSYYFAAFTFSLFARFW